MMMMMTTGDLGLHVLNSITVHITEIRTFKVYAIFFPQCFQRENFSGSNTDVLFSTPVSNSFLSPSDKNPIAADLE